MLLLDLDSLPTPLLVSMMIRCNEEIQNEQDNLDPCLMAVVGMLVSVLGSRDVVVEGGEQKSGVEYRDRVSTRLKTTFLIYPTQLQILHTLKICKMNRSSECSAMPTGFLVTLCYCAPFYVMCHRCLKVNGTTPRMQSL